MTTGIVSDDRARFESCLEVFQKSYCSVSCVPKQFIFCPEILVVCPFELPKCSLTFPS